MEPRISIITLGVSDLKRMRQFYEQGLGWPASSASNEHICFLKTGGVVLALFPRDHLAADATVPSEGNGFRGFTIAHNVPERAQVAKCLAEAEKAGGRIVKSAQDVFWGGHSGYFSDPEGNLWEVAWNPGFPFKADGSLALPD